MPINEKELDRIVKKASGKLSLETLDDFSNFLHLIEIETEKSQGLASL